ncbi:carboxypeptidase-like regulatory domain-containing protein [Ferruginivarius sediminum]|uniref:Carboxypeptidase regulatory-like domain-containing protein n=1 Tax=Ferruginivarius sediminum TaxID=2661937 RepID=A0A369TCI6_9PROT|nr:carboxypeptidase-like regulatory domain-containing protein [Ferruginivarius sediminum]RDD61877.1 carboxypeptidase regulatory-like domain-containing protein [Ferruginivarius sediminum]
MRWLASPALVFLLIVGATSAVFAAELSGWVLQSNGNPMANASLQLVRQDGGETFTGTTDNQGRYSFEHIPPGRYVLRAGGAERQVYVEPGFNSANLRQ